VDFVLIRLGLRGFEGEDGEQIVERAFDFAASIILGGRLARDFWRQYVMGLSGSPG
jgi:hypothetical protein